MLRSAMLGALAMLGEMTFTSAGNAFDLQGHRGARGLLPENTLQAFALALDIGVSTIESDMAITKDGIVVLSHSAQLNPDITRAADGRWIKSPAPLIRDLTLEEVKRFDVGRIRAFSTYSFQLRSQKAIDGARIPTLAELFELTVRSGKQPRFNLETKISPLNPAETAAPDVFARIVVDVVRSAGMQSRTTIQSFDWRTLVEVKRIEPGIETSCLTVRTAFMDTISSRRGRPSPWLAGLDPDKFAGSLPRMAKAIGCRTWSPYYANLTPAEVSEAHRLELLVLPWTVNSALAIRRVVAMGADGLITDYPDRARAVLNTLPSSKPRGTN